MEYCEKRMVGVEGTTPTLGNQATNNVASVPSTGVVLLRSNIMVYIRNNSLSLLEKLATQHS